MKKVAFLYLIYDEINNECLWRNYFRKVNKDRYSIYIHWKYDKKLGYLDQFRLTNTIPTEYAELSLVKAQNLLLREALKDQNNERFVFLSNSCIPLKSFDYTYNSLFLNELCYFNAAREEHVFERNRGRVLTEAFGLRNVKKASQWSILTRPMARVLSESDDVLGTCFEPGRKDLADEYFYLSYLHYLDKQQHLHISDYSTVDCSTFEFWEDKEYKFRDNFTSDHPESWDRRLKTYFDISENELAYLLNAQCYFGRKFSKNCSVNGESSIEDMITNCYNL